MVANLGGKSLSSLCFHARSSPGFLPGSPASVPPECGVRAFPPPAQSTLRLWRLKRLCRGGERGALLQRLELDPSVGLWSRFPRSGGLPGRLRRSGMGPPSERSWAVRGGRVSGARFGIGSVRRESWRGR